MKKLWVIFAALILMACSKEKNYVDCENCEIIFYDKEGKVELVINSKYDWKNTLVGGICKCTSYCEYFNFYKSTIEGNPNPGNIKFKCK